MVRLRVKLRASERATGFRRQLSPRRSEYRCSAAQVAVRPTSLRVAVSGRANFVYASAVLVAGTRKSCLVVLQDAHRDVPLGPCLSPVTARSRAMMLCCSVISGCAVPLALSLYSSTRPATRTLYVLRPSEPSGMCRFAFSHLVLLV